jgi:hypothetical protein
MTYKEGNKPWNRGIKGVYKLSQQTREKMSQASKGVRKSEEHRKNMSLCKKGLKRGEESKTKQSNTRKRLFEQGKLIQWNKGKKGVQIPWNRGKKMSEDSRKKMSRAKIGKPSWSKGKTSLDDQRIVSGPRSGMWKGGVTKLNHKIRTHVKYLNWRQEVFERDRYTCQLCNSKGCYLEAHHKKPLRIIIKEHKIRTDAQIIKCEELWDINNGITLCMLCHAKIDKRRANTIIKQKGGQFR